MTAKPPIISVQVAGSGMGATPPSGSVTLKTQQCPEAEGHKPAHDLLHCKRLFAQGNVNAITPSGTTLFGLGCDAVLQALVSATRPGRQNLSLVPIEKLLGTSVPTVAPANSYSRWRL